MFIIQRYLQRREELIHDWETAGRAWVKEKNDDEYRYHRYSLSDYASNHPYPVVRLRPILATVFPILIVITVVSSVVLYTVTRPPKPVDPNNPNDCSNLVKKGDNVIVTEGDFRDSTGTILEQKKDCSVNITLTKSTYTHKEAQDQGYQGRDAREVGETLNVDRQENFTKL